MKLSLIIPAYNEEGNLENTVRALTTEFEGKIPDYEILIVNDNSTDNTERILTSLMQEFKQVRYVNNKPPNGIGFAIRKGLDHYHGDAAAIVMADNSDPAYDIVRFYNKMLEGYECVFGSRFIRGGKTFDYPIHKLVLNRLFNNFIRVLFGFRYNDTTNAFKMYRRHVLNGLKPYLSNHFNITVELPLKSIIRGYRYTVIPNHWKNRTEGISNLRIKEMGSRYLFIVLYCFIERWLSRGDYKRDH